MILETHDILNEIYTPIYQKAKSILKCINSGECSGKIGWFNLHTKKHNESFITEFYPIPVITIDSVCDIGIDIDSIFIEFTLLREDALCYNFEELVNNYTIEVYGVDDYKKDFYDSNINSTNINLKIQESKETQIHIALYVSHNEDDSKIVDIINRICRNNNI